MKENVHVVKRWLAGSLAVLPQAATGLLAIFCLQQSNSVFNETRELETQIEKVEHEILQTKYINDSLSDLATQIDEFAIVFHGKSHTVAAAELSRIVDGILKRVGGYRTSMRILTPIIQQPFDQVLVKLQAEISILSLRDFLFTMENYPVLLAVHQISMQPIGDHDADGMLQVDLVVAGHFRTTD